MIDHRMLWALGMHGQDSAVPETHYMLAQPSSIESSAAHLCDVQEEDPCC